jgi:hypothetical protein
MFKQMICGLVVMATSHCIGGDQGQQNKNFFLAGDLQNAGRAQRGAILNYNLGICIVCQSIKCRGIVPSFIDYNRARQNWDCSLCKWENMPIDDIDVRLE